MKFKYLIITTLFCLISSGSAVANHIPDDAPPVAILKAILDLSDEQIGEIRELLEARSEAVQPIAEQVRELQNQLEEEVNSDAPDPGEVGDIVLDIRMLRQEIAQHQENFQEAFRMILNPTQLERIGHIQGVALAVRAAKALGELGLR